MEDCWPISFGSTEPDQSHYSLFIRLFDDIDPATTAFYPTNAACCLIDSGTAGASALVREAMVTRSATARDLGNATTILHRSASRFPHSGRIGWVYA